MSRDESEPTDDEPDDGEAPDDEAGIDDTGDAKPTDGWTDHDAETDAPSAESDRDEFGIASDLVTGRSGEADGADRTESPDGADRDGDVGDGRESTVPDDSHADDGGSDGEAPLSSLASSVSERRSSTGERPDDELFDQEDVPEIDADVVWERLGEDEPPDVPEDTEHDVRVIEKRNYCEQCPFFSTPPDVSCGHDGTEIVELVDMEHFRVVNCPKVLEDERLERL